VGTGARGVAVAGNVVVMGHPLRFDRRPFPQHVISRGVHGDRLVPHDDAAEILWHSIGRHAADQGLEVGAMCLMGTHYHLIVRGSSEALSLTLHRAHSHLANVRNAVERRRGAVFGRRYREFPMRDERHLRNATRYVHLNPVESGLCRHPADWTWSTFRILAGTTNPPAWFDRTVALRLLGQSSPRAFERLVLAGTPVEPPPMSKGELTMHRVHVLASEGLTIAEITAVTGISTSHAHRLLRSYTGPR